ncbi:MAG: phosphoribosylanthranilate isomerase [Candidatus Brocadiia bacterium]
MAKVKICGVTSPRDALMAAAAGADAVGFNFFPPSPRYVEPDWARAMRMALPPFVAAVGVFVDRSPERVRDIMRHCRLDYAQLHGHESPQVVEKLKEFRIIKAVRVRDEDDLSELERYDVDAFLLDAYVEDQPGGTGSTFDWDLARQASARAKLLLAGGLTPNNVAKAVHTARPYAVDVASGVEEEPGVKSRDLVTDFVLEAKSVLL